MFRLLSVLSRSFPASISPGGGVFPYGDVDVVCHQDLLSFLVGIVIGWRVLLVLVTVYCLPDDVVDLARSSLSLAL